MITELSFGNFKSWKRVEKMRFAPITGFFGSNSSGKTSLLQLLLMMKQTVESTDRLQVLDFGGEKSPANLGSFRDVVFSHQAPGTLDWHIRWRLNERLAVKKPEDKKADLCAGDEVGFQVEITENEKKRLVVNHVVYSFAGRDFAIRRKPAGKDNYELTVTPSDDFRFIRTRGRAWDPRRR